MRAPARTIRGARGVGGARGVARGGGSLRLLAAALLLALGGGACASGVSGTIPRGFPAEALPLSLERFAGAWYVIAHIPLEAEENAYAAVERYSLRDDGWIEVDYRFCEGTAKGPLEHIEMWAWVHDEATNAEWRVRPFWPLALDYQILELDPDYEVTVIGHPSKRWAWIMSRERRMDEGRLAAAIARLGIRGYDLDDLRRVPQPAESCRTAEVG